MNKKRVVEEGYQAHFAMTSADECPYSFPMLEYEWWHEGFYQGRLENIRLAREENALEALS